MKSYVLDTRLNIESGTDHRGVYEQGITFASGTLHVVPVGNWSITVSYDPKWYIRLDIDGLGEWARVEINSYSAFHFRMPTEVSDDYVSYRFLFMGRWYVLELRIRSIED